MRKIPTLAPPKPPLKKVSAKPSLYELEKLRKKEEEVEAKLREIVPGWLNQLINISNGILVHPPDFPVSYRFYIKLGNNASIVKNFLK